MKNYKNTIIAAASAILLCAAVSSASATLLVPGTTVTPVPTTIYPPPGTTLVTSISSAFNNGAISGTLNTYVYSGNTFGGYTFVYEIQAGTLAPNESISQLSTSGFGGLMVDVSQAPFPTGTNQAVTDVGRSAAPGDILRWEFQVSGLGSLDSNENSYYLIATTNATGFHFANVGIIDGTSVNVLSIVPSVPDGGSTVALLGVAVAGLHFVRRKLAAR